MAPGPNTLSERASLSWSSSEKSLPRDRLTDARNSEQMSRRYGFTRMRVRQPEALGIDNASIAGDCDRESRYFELRHERGCGRLHCRACARPYFLKRRLGAVRGREACDSRGQALLQQPPPGDLAYPALPDVAPPENGARALSKVGFRQICSGRAAYIFLQSSGPRHFSITT